MICNYLDKSFWKYILVGIINTLFGTIIMFLFYNVFHFSYWISSVSNYIFGSIISYFLNKYFTFQNKNRSIKIVFKFIINITICYLIAYGMAKPVIRIVFSDLKLSVRENLAMLTGMGIFVILNYLGQRFFAFKMHTDIKDRSNNEH